MGTDRPERLATRWSLRSPRLRESLKLLNSLEPPASRANHAEYVRSLCEVAPEVRARHLSRVDHVVACRFDTGIDPAHQVEEGPAELRRREVAVRNAADRALHEQVALAVRGDPLRVFDLVEEGDEEVAQ